MSSKRRKKGKRSSGDERDPLEPSVEYMPLVFKDKKNATPPDDASHGPGGATSEDASGHSEACCDDHSHSSGKSKKRKSVEELLSEQAQDRELEGKRRRLIADAWTSREQIYQQLFGKPAYVTPGEYAPPSTEVPADFFERQEQVMSDTGNPGDPTLDEQHLSILAYGPDPLRPYWTYVTAGLATPWLQYETLEASGFGCELLVKSPDDAPWAPQFLQSLAFYIFNHAGLLSPGVRIGLNGPIDPASESELKNAFIWYADEAPDGMYELPSGYFAILCAVGMTNDERSFAESVEEYGTWCINAVLRKTGHGQITDPKRSSVLTRPDIEEIMSSITSFANAFRLSNADAETAEG